VAHVPRLENIHVSAAGKQVTFEWKWSGVGAVEVRVLRSDQWYCDDPEAYVDGSWGQGLAYEGQAGRYVDDSADPESELFYSVFAHFHKGEWRPPVQVRVFREGQDAEAAGPPESGDEWQTTAVAKGHRPVEVGGNVEETPLGGGLVADYLGGGGPGETATVAGQTVAHMRPLAPVTAAGPDPRALRTWRLLWVLLGVVGVPLLVFAGTRTTIVAWIAAAFVLTAVYRAVQGREAGSPWWLRLGAIALVVVGGMVTFLLGFFSAIGTMVGGNLGRNAPLWQLVIAFAVFVVVGLISAFGGFIFGMYAYDREDLPRRLWVMAALVVLGAAAIFVPPVGLALTVVLSIVAWYHQGRVSVREKAVRRAQRHMRIQHEAQLAREGRAKANAPEESWLAADAPSGEQPAPSQETPGAPRVEEW